MYSKDQQPLEKLKMLATKMFSWYFWVVDSVNPTYTSNERRH